MRSADRLSSGVVTVAPAKVTPLCAAPRRCVAVTVWNRTGVDLGIGGSELATDQMLPDGSSYRVWIGDASKVHLLHLGPGPVEVAFTIEE